MKRRTLIAFIALWLGGTAPFPLRAEKLQQPRATPTDEFFIISSVDARKKQVVLKRPTEVTELVQVTAQTACFDESGTRLKFEELRAGDTVYVVLRADTKGIPIALRLRKGPMTLNELHSRYLHAFPK